MSAGIRRAQPWLGTLVDIAASGESVAQAVNQAFEAVAMVHRLMSYHDPDSDVSRINREAALAPVTVHPWTWQVLAAAREFSAQSGGLFDITVAPLLARLGYLPRHADFPRASGQGDWRHVELLSAHRVRLARRVRIDLGGIAKGFAVDRALDVLREHGVSSARVNAGGDLRLFGPNWQPLNVRHPAAPTRLLHVTDLRAGAAATSAGYFAAQRVHGRCVTPHIHPLRRQALAPGSSVTVLAPDCITADALTKIVLADREAARRLLPRFEARALLLERDDHSGAWQLYELGCQEACRV
ncbi:FAD:protein FMN transferase [Thiobacter aerophilum]|uniref:FAD:protein FMN transferase n=1 Tax=Thiobacter aerophilum TaxID=3121275 RepID=A0ABV0EF47_9BURK